ncbi:MAG: hypothetical protein AAFN74_00455 [Myxococcota bacterium]
MSESEVIAAFIRALIWSVVLYWILANRVFRPTTKTLRRSPFTPVAQLAFTFILAVHGLTLLGLLDTVSVTATIIVVAWVMRRRHPRADKYPLSLTARLLFYDLLDGRLAWKRSRQVELDPTPAADLRRAGRFRRRWPQWLVAATLVSFAVVLRWPAVVDYPFASTSTELVDIVRLKEMGAGRIEGLFSSGVYALALILRIFTLLDEMLLWKILSIIVVLAGGSIVFVSVRVLANSGRYPPPFIAASLVALFPGSGLTGRLPFDAVFYPIQLTALIVTIALVMHANAAVLATFGLLSISAVVAFCHPLAWMITAAAVVVSLLGGVAFGIRLTRHSRTLYSLVFGALIASFALFWQIKGQDGVRFLSLFDAVKGGADDELIRVPLISAAIASCLFIFAAVDPQRFERDRVKVLFCSSALGLTTLVIIPRLGGWLPVSNEALLDLLLPTAAVVVGLAIDVAVGQFALTRHWARQWAVAPALFFVAVLWLVYPPVPALALKRRESKAALTAYLKIQKSFVPHTWTVIAHPELASHALGYGWHMPRREFLKRYTVAQYEWHPQKPEATVPSPHTFLIVEKINGPTFLTMPDSLSEEDEANLALREWCEWYIVNRGGMRVYYDDPSVTVYHLERSREEEREVLGRIWREAQTSDGE